MSTMEENGTHVKTSRESLKASMDMRIVGLNFGLAIVLIIFLIKRIYGFQF